jgi:hypothetical protein
MLAVLSLDGAPEVIISQVDTQAEMAHYETGFVSYTIFLFPLLRVGNGWLSTTLVTIQNQ